MKIKKKTIVIITIFILVVLILLIVRENKGIVLVSESPDGQYKLVVRETKAPFLFGSAEGRMTLKKGYRKVAELDFEVANDGGPLEISPIIPTWYEDRVEVIVWGDESGKDAYALKMDGTTYHPNLSPVIIDEKKEGMVEITVYLDMRQMNEQSLFIVQDGEYHDKISIESDQMVDYCFSKAENGYEELAIILSDSQTGAQELVYIWWEEDGEFWDPPFLSVVVKQGNLLSGTWSQGVQTILKRFCDREFLKDIRLSKNEDESYVLIENGEERFSISCDVSGTKWKKEDGTVLFYFEENENEKELWCKYEFPKVDSKEIGSYHVCMKGNRKGESYFIWSSSVSPFSSLTK